MRKSAAFRIPQGEEEKRRLDESGVISTERERQSTSQRVNKGRREREKRKKEGGKTRAAFKLPTAVEDNKMG